MSEIDIGTIGTRGLVVFDESKYKYVEEDRWRSSGPLTNHSAFDGFRSIGAVVACVENEAVYVDLDKLVELRAGSEVPGQPSAWRASPRSIVLREGDKFYQVTRQDLRELDDGFEGDAGVVVNRGAVVAAIPNNSIPSGTYCVLVNLASLFEDG